MVFLPSCGVELVIAEMACVSRNIRRTFHVLFGVSVQRSISGRDVSYPVKLNSSSQKWRAFPETSAERFTFFSVFRSNVPFLNAITHILCIVELGLTGLTSTSQNSRTTASSPLRYSGPVFQS